MAAFRDRIGTGRKLAIQILEFLVLKTGKGESPSRVRIPVPPPLYSRESAI
ncbi:hypothetical protein HIO72_00700 [Halomonas sp. PA5]|uniref:SelB domain-containing protein n=1 Tax=Halomonas sp. PA5 TaxID=2730357 RepID=UPI0015975D3A|nr:hypothetical protein HIO72_00700 [Halomonas sp. PA5]